MRARFEHFTTAARDYAWGLWILAMAFRSRKARRAGRALKQALREDR